MTTKFNRIFLFLHDISYFVLIVIFLVFFNLTLKFFVSKDYPANRILSLIKFDIFSEFNHYF